MAKKGHAFGRKPKAQVESNVEEKNEQSVVEEVEAVKEVEEVTEVAPEKPLPVRPAIIPKSPIVVKQAVDLVLVRGVRDHKCTIMREVIAIKKGQDFKLSKSIATILAQAGVVIFR